MTLSNRKQIILDQLSQEDLPISLPKLLNKLPEDYAERSVRRWLRELADEHLIKISGLKRGTNYQIIKNLIEQTKDIKTCFGSESNTVIAKIRLPIYERQPTSYHEKWFDMYQPNINFYISSTLM